MAAHLNVFLSIRKKEEDTPIYQKHDGQRFLQPHTTKLNINTDYAVKVMVRPPLKLLEIVLQGEGLTLEELKRKQDDEDDTISYSSHFSTSGYDVTKPRKRKDIPLSFVFQRGCSLMTTLQCKLYPEKEVQHAHWGQALTWLEYECKVEEGSTHIDVVREHYL